MDVNAAVVQFPLGSRNQFLFFLAVLRHVAALCI